MGVPLVLPEVSPQPHTHIAFEGFQYAKYHGKANEYNHRVLEAFFRDGRDICDLEVLTALAGEVGLDEQEFHESLRNCKYRAAHQAALRYAYQEVGVEGVPLFVIGDRMLSGVQDRETLESVIDEELAKSGCGSS
jgi:predicted DsbA family dithiol-disulfide isomerase